MMFKGLIGARRLSTGDTPNFGLRMDKQNCKEILDMNGIDWEDIDTSLKFDTLLSCGQECIDLHTLFSLFANDKSLKGELSLGKHPDWKEWTKELYHFDSEIQFEAMFEWDDDVLYIDITDERFMLWIYAFKKLKPSVGLKLVA